MIEPVTDADHYQLLLSLIRKKRMTNRLEWAYIERWAEKWFKILNKMPAPKEPPHDH